MPESNEEVDTSSTTEPLRRFGTRRAVLTGVAGVALLAGPAVFAMTAMAGEEPDVETADGETGEIFATLNENAENAAARSRDLRNDALAAQEAEDQAKEAASTTTAPPTTAAPTTTEAPAPPPTEPPPPPPEPAPEPAPDPGPQPAGGGSGLGDPYYEGSWDQLAQCESGGDWSTNTGNGFYGGIQFQISSWQAVGGSGLPSDASREEQIARGQALWEMQGWGAWPACTSSFGWR